MLPSHKYIKPKFSKATILIPCVTPFYFYLLVLKITALQLQARYKKIFIYAVNFPD